jgi:hypothetical protein
MQTKPTQFWKQFAKTPNKARSIVLPKSINPSSNFKKVVKNSKAACRNFHLLKLKGKSQKSSLTPMITKKKTQFHNSQVQRKKAR